MDIFLSKEEHDALWRNHGDASDDDDDDSSSISSSSSNSDSSSSSSASDSPKKVKTDISQGAKSKKKPFWSAKPIIYMKGLPFTATIEEIRNMFCDCGEITSITRQLNDAGRWTGAVTVRFKDSASMNHALKLDGTIWSGTGGGNMHFLYFPLMLTFLQMECDMCASRNMTPRQRKPHRSLTISAMYMLATCQRM